MDGETFRLLDLPAEVSLKIYEHTFGLQNPDRMLLVPVGLRNTECVSPSSIRERYSAAVLRLDRQVRKEASKVVFTKVNMLVEMDFGQSHCHFGAVLGSAKDINFWPYLKHLQFEIDLRLPAKLQLGTMRPMETFLEAIEYGKHLRRLRVVLTTRSLTPMSSLISERIRLLSLLYVKGSVKVLLHIPPPWQGMAGLQAEQDMQQGEALCKDLENIIRGIQATST